MFKTKQLSHAVAAALLTLSGTQLAFAVDELEAKGEMGVNDSIVSAQRLTLSPCPDGYPADKLCVEVTGVIGATDPAAVPIADVDFYAFDAMEGDVVMIDIDGGMKPFDFSVRSVDTMIAVFGPLPSVVMQRENNDTDPTVPRDAGSEHIGDSLIPDFRAPATGTYVVGVSSKPRAFVEGGGTISTTVTGTSARFPNGAYKLIISGVSSPTPTPPPPPVVTPPPPPVVTPPPPPVVTPPPPPVVTPPPPPPAPVVQHINIDIKPGNDVEAYLNPKAKGALPVAILSNAEFDALKVDQKTLTFGRKGDERSYLRCLKQGLDVNADGRLDLVCHFDNEYAGWKAEDVEGVLRGKTTDGKEFKGTARLKVKQRAE